jgi:hypothetical protein
VPQTEREQPPHDSETLVIDSKSNAGQHKNYTISGHRGAFNALRGIPVPGEKYE